MSEHRTDATLAAMIEIEFRSDNAAGVAPEIMAAVSDANAGTALAYGADAVTAQLESVVHVGRRQNA